MRMRLIFATVAVLFVSLMACSASAAATSNAASPAPAAAAAVSDGSDLPMVNFQVKTQWTPWPNDVNRQARYIMAGNKGCILEVRWTRFQDQKSIDIGDPEPMRYPMGDACIG